MKAELIKRTTPALGRLEHGCPPFAPGNLRRNALQLAKKSSRLIIMADDETVDFKRELFNRFDQVHTKLDRMLQAIETVAASVGSLDEPMSLERNETDLIRQELLLLEHRINSMNAHLERIERRLDDINPPPRSRYHATE
ncbi:MAG: hypothetical protein ACLP7P_10285 [Rhodomicrobium sp.]